MATSSSSGDSDSDGYPLSSRIRGRLAPVHGDPDEDEEVNIGRRRKRARLRRLSNVSIWNQEDAEEEEEESDQYEVEDIRVQSEEERDDDYIEDEELEEESDQYEVEDGRGESEEEKDEHDHIEDEEEEPNNEPQVYQLTDPELFDCPICCAPLTIPVYQCEINGHIACSSCLSKLNNRCPSCSVIGFNRCRVFERALESFTTSCHNIQYGCKESVTCNRKSEHQKACVYSPACSCPRLYCNFVSSAKQLYKHFSSCHVSSATRFKYYSSFLVSLNANDNFLVLQEKKDGTLFILNNCVKVQGNAVTISCIQPGFMGGFFYELEAKTKDNSLILRSVTKSTPTRQVINDSCPKPGFLFIPCDFRSSCGQLKMELCIWGKGHYPFGWEP